jgi:dolichyl-diphosphooligosaccharide--protein glycosyltransferase
MDIKLLVFPDNYLLILGMANRTVLVDNNTWNNTHIATVGKMMSCSEEVSYEVMKKHDVDYALVIFGGLLGYSGDDINKFLWMIRIGEGVYPNDIHERDFFTSNGEYKVDEGATPTMKRSLLYKMSYYRFNEFNKVYGRAVDRVRGVTIPDKPINLVSVDEAFTSQNWIVRIYKVKKDDSIGRSLNAAASFGKRSNKRRKSRSVKKL